MLVLETNFVTQPARPFNLVTLHATKLLCLPRSLMVKKSSSSYSFFLFLFLKNMGCKFFGSTQSYFLLRLLAKNAGHWPSCLSCSFGLLEIQRLQLLCCYSSDENSLFSFCFLRHVPFFDGLDAIFQTLSLVNNCEILY